MTLTFYPSRTLAAMSDTIQISQSNGQVVVDQPQKRVLNSRPRLVWTAPFEFMLDFRRTGHSPVNHGQFRFNAKSHQNSWRVVILVKDVVYDTPLEYDIVTEIGTLDPAIIIDPN